MRLTYSSFNRIKMKLYILRMIEDNEFNAMIGLIEMNDMLEEDDSQATSRVVGGDEAKRRDGSQVGSKLGVEAAGRAESSGGERDCRGAGEKPGTPATGAPRHRVRSADE